MNLKQLEKDYPKSTEKLLFYIEDNYKSGSIKEDVSIFDSSCIIDLGHFFAINGVAMSWIVGMGQFKYAVDEPDNNEGTCDNPKNIIKVDSYDDMIAKSGIDSFKMLESKL